MCINILLNTCVLFIIYDVLQVYPKIQDLDEVCSISVVYECSVVFDTSEIL